MVVMVAFWMAVGVALFMGKVAGRWHVLSCRLRIGARRDFYLCLG